MKLQKIRYLLLGLGFLGIFLSTILGSLIGAKINSYLLTSHNPIWLQSLEKTLLVSAHSHFNLMAIVMMLMGLSLHLVWKKPYLTILPFVVWINIVSVPIFVCGLICKAFVSYSVVVSGIAALGAIGYMISIAVYAGLFLLSLRPG